MRVAGRISAAAWLTFMSCVVALTACTTPGSQRSPAAQHRPARRHTSSPEVAPPSFPQLEGVYTQPGRSFAVTYQGWWLDLQSQQIRQLSPVGSGTFTYGPGW